MADDYRNSKYFIETIKERAKKRQYNKENFYE